jgi:competence protein ComEC
MRSAIVGFAIGAAVLQMCATLSPLYLLILLMGVALFCALFARRLRRAAIRIPMLAACGMLIGFAWAGLFASHYLAQQLPKDWEGRDVTLIGTIDSLPYTFEQGVRFNFAVERAVAPDGAASAVPRRLALSWRSAFGKEERQDSVLVRPGERWQLTVRLHRPHGNANPYGFDYEVWLLEQKLRATGYVRPDSHSTLKNRRLDAFVPTFGNVVERCRGWLQERIYRALPDKKYAGVIVALVIGDQRAISQSDWKVFNRTGISHLISI